MDRPVRVALYGVGAVSSLIAKALLQRQGIEIVSAIDIAEDKVGRDLGDVLGLSRELGVKIVGDVKEAFSKVKPDIVIHATSSRLEIVRPQILACIKERVNVVSTCEELVYPYLDNKILAEELDRLAKQYEVSVLGTGINPGFLMDTLPIIMTAPCLEVRSLKVTRMMNSGRRRGSYQKKVGTGLTEDDFRKKMRNKEITGHVGLKVSITMIADSLGWNLDEIIEMPPEPVLAEKTIETEYRTVEKGYVAGLKSRAYGIVNGEKIIELEFVSYAGMEEEYDSVEVNGVPDIKLNIEGGVHGDIGTIAMIINSIPRVINSSPGLHTMRDLPIPSAALNKMSKYVKK